MQYDKVSYYQLTSEIKQKKEGLSQWISQSPFVGGPSLEKYIKTTAKGKFGNFPITLKPRDELAKKCSEHIQRLLQELDRRFAPSPLRENLTVLFDPKYLVEHKNEINSPNYGRSAVNYLRDKYQNLHGFDSSAVAMEWERLKNPLSDFVDVLPVSESKIETFWTDFIKFKTSFSDQFIDEHKNILILLGVFLISPTNSAECERGVSLGAFMNLLSYIQIFSI